jgi:hypothetical protein
MLGKVKVRPIVHVYKTMQFYRIVAIQYHTRNS